jgi:hypothetical protein
LDDEELTYKDIGSRFGITASRVEQILSANCVLINTAKDWEKTKRKRLLKRWIKKLGDSRKDPADLLEQLRKEDEGDTVLIDQSQHDHYTVVWEKKNAENSDRVSTSRIPAEDTR